MVKLYNQGVDIFSGLRWGGADLDGGTISRWAQSTSLEAQTANNKVLLFMIIWYIFNSLNVKLT